MESSSSIFSLMRAFDSPAAKRMAFLTPLAVERPLAITHTHRTPNTHNGTAPDRRAAQAKGCTLITYSHDGELYEMLGLRIHVGADVEQDRNAAFGIWKRRGPRHAVPGLQRAKQEARDGHDRAGVPG